MAENKKQEPRRETGGAITRDYLESQLANVRQQKESARNSFHQASGAEAVLVNMLARLDEGDPPTELHERQ